jgi:hypothetical protein
MKCRAFLRDTFCEGVSLPSSPILGANYTIRIGAIRLGSFIKIVEKGRKTADSPFWCRNVFEVRA